MKTQYTHFLDTLWGVSDVILIHRSGIVSPHELADGRFILTVENVLLHCIIYLEKIYEGVRGDTLYGTSSFSDSSLIACYRKAFGMNDVFESLIKANAQIRAQDIITLRSHTDKESV